MIPINLIKNDVKVLNITDWTWRMEMIALFFSLLSIQPILNMAITLKPPA